MIIGAWMSRMSSVAVDPERRVQLVSAVVFAALVAVAALSLAARSRESEPRTSAAQHSAGPRHHLRVTPELKHAESSHRPELSPDERDFTGVGF
jgi:hypothetical protein